MNREVLGIFEFQLLSTLTGGRNDRYGAQIQVDLSERLGKEVSIGAVYTTLERLEKKGFVSSKWGEATAARGGRKKRYYEISAPGIKALERSQAAWRVDGVLSGVCGP